MPSVKALVSGGIVVLVALVVYDKFVRGRI
jgi:hypothetical protein